MSRTKLVAASAMALALYFGGGTSAKAQDWSDYLHWPYVPPQTPGNGFNYTPLYDNFYVYPREQRIVPQIQGPYYRNYYGGRRILGMRHYHGLFSDIHYKKFYYGNHFALDVF